jgi:hypothetical protein
LFDDLTVKHGLKLKWDVSTTDIKHILRDFCSSKYENFEFPPVIKEVVDTLNYANNLWFNDEMHLASELFEVFRNNYESDLPSKVNKIFESYPMLDFVEHTFTQAQADKVKDYINLVG